MTIRSVRSSASTRTQNISSAMGNRVLFHEQLTNNRVASKLDNTDLNTKCDISSMIILQQDTFESK